MQKLLTRDAFREGVLARDNHRCVFCGAPALDQDGRGHAHHILERRLFQAPEEFGGYFIDNGASVCEEHHLACEMTTISVEEVRAACGITKPVIPLHFYSDQVYDKWGNIVLPNGRRLRGELFNDDSVQKVLGQGGVLDLFTHWVKYPRTHHLPWSEGLSEDDRVLHNLDSFIGKRVIVTEKMDGECLLSSTKITMGDRTKKNIGDIVRSRLIGSEVLGVDEHGKIVKTKITNVYFNGNTEEWLSVNIKGRHSTYHSVRCTPRHEFYVGDGIYRRADELRPGDRAFIFEQNFRLGKKITFLEEESFIYDRLREVFVHSIKPYLHNTNRGKYDIETETHNYFANGTLVHNCTSLYQDYIHARSLDGRNHASRNWVKNFWGQICGDIPEGWRVCGENLFAKHSIAYNALPTYFMGFSIWNERNECLAWDETLEWFTLLGIVPVPVLYDGIYDEKAIRVLYDSKKDWEAREGYVLRVADRFSYGQFRTSVAKYVRKGHVMTTKHWMYGREIEQNGLA